MGARRSARRLPTWLSRSLRHCSRRPPALSRPAGNLSIDHLISHNPVSGIFRSKGGRKASRVKPLLWTAERVEHWERTGKVPAKVMVWSRAQARSFLDFCQAIDERLYALYHLDVHYGPRRSELAGLERPDMSVTTKAAASMDHAPAPRVSGGCRDRTGRCAAGRLNFHGVRHGAATVLLAAKVPSKVISDILGHASTSFTEDVYTVVAEELAAEAAQAISRFVSGKPRKSRK
jgi:integrase